VVEFLVALENGAIDLFVRVRDRLRFVGRIGRREILR